jgi:hypothetical protein
MTAAGSDDKYPDDGQHSFPTFAAAAFERSAFSSQKRPRGFDVRDDADDDDEHDGRLSAPRRRTDEPHVQRERTPHNIPGFVPANQPGLTSLPFLVGQHPPSIVRMDETGDITAADAQTEPISSEWKGDLSVDDGLTVSFSDLKVESNASDAKSDDRERKRGHMSRQEVIAQEEMERSTDEKCMPDAEPHHPLGQYATLVESLKAYHLRNEQEKADSCKFRERRQVVLDPRVGAMCAGEIRYLAVHRMYRHLAKISKFVLEPTQKEFIEEFIASCAPLIYGDDWNTNSAQWRKTYKRAKVHYQVMCLTPRRFGKTTSVVLFVTALALVVPNIKIIILSQNERTSKLLLGECQKLITLFQQNDPAQQDRVGISNNKEITIVPEEEARGSTKTSRKNNPNASSIKAFPSTGDGTFVFLPPPSIAG